MRALTLRQPWASLVAHGVKTIETRGWSTTYRGPLLIHAAARKPDVEMLEDGPAGDEEWGQWFETPEGDWTPPAPPPWLRWGLALAPKYDIVRMPLGAVVAVCTLTDVVPIVRGSDVIDRPGVFVHDYPVLDGRSLWLCQRRHDGSIDSLDRVEDQRPYGDFTPGRFAWLLSDVRPLTSPVPAKGRQGPWTPDPGLLAAVEGSL